MIPSDPLSARIRNLANVCGELPPAELARRLVEVAEDLERGSAMDRAWRLARALDCHASVEVFGTGERVHTDACRGIHHADTIARGSGPDMETAVEQLAERLQDVVARRIAELRQDAADETDDMEAAELEREADYLAARAT